MINSNAKHVNPMKKIALGLIGLLIVIQFIHPERNTSNDNTYAISKKYIIPDHVNTILTRCM